VRRYGQWAGNERGNPEDPTRCVVEVWPASGSWIPYQCQRKRVAGVLCKQHEKQRIAGRNLSIPEHK